MGKTLKWGIVGAGGIFRGAHVKPLKDHPEVEIAAVCDIHEEKARQAAKDYGIPAVFTIWSNHRTRIKLIM